MSIYCIYIVNNIDDPDIQAILRYLYPPSAGEY